MADSPSVAIAVITQPLAFSMFRVHYKSKSIAVLTAIGIAAWMPCLLCGQLTGNGSNPTSGLRPVQQGSEFPSTSGSTAPPMVPLSSTGPMGFDPYGAGPSRFTGGGGLVLPSPSVAASSLPPMPSTVGSAPAYSSLQPGYPSGAPGAFQGAPGYFQGIPGSLPGNPVPGNFGGGIYPSYTGPAPILPGAGPSAIVQTSPSIAPYQSSGPGLYPNSTPSALFPGSYGGGYGTGGSGGMFGNLFGNWFGGSSGPGFGGSYPSAYGYNQPTYNPNFGGPAYPSSGSWWPYSSGGAGGYNWNPQGAIYPGQMGQAPAFIRLFQGPRFRHAYIHGDKRHDSLAINDTDIALAFVIPQFLFTTQPLYLLPSFSFHQWNGPRSHLDPANNADLPSKAFSAFLDTGWQSDPSTIFGAELGVRVGVFSDFDAISSESVRVMGRGIGRVRLTPQTTFKLGALYLDRNRVKLLPAGGILWQPNPATRLDLFFPEPKLSAYLTTLGNIDTWWYVAGYYGGGAWTVQRNDGSKDSIDINDIRVLLGLEWGRNDMMRDGRRIGFAEIGYAFDRELLYKRRPADNLDLQDNFVLRIGFGY